MLNQISKCTRLSRRSLGLIEDKTIVMVKEKRTCISKSVAESVIDFLGREDNCRIQPGKADAKKVNGHKEKKQTKVLTDYLKKLHMKDKSEIPEQNISLSTFTRIRPPSILLTSYISRNSCQCIYHQNTALKVQTLRKHGVKISENPEQLIRHEHDLDEQLAGLPERVLYRVWKKVEINNGKTKMKIAEETEEKTNFIADLKIQIKTFSQHVLRVQEQYNQIRKLKVLLPENIPIAIGFLLKTCLAYR
ncbi:hypothetical protein DPMN_010848 [Dreissena polymorpha]|uniref:Uncharacterized protein n=1 Tax=Dreissena polymorpha TaxID=45954 RepID=A0A9D4N0N3_DREPO|nr:hypothetical protein DPMN_010848 [Dreissena polymorpha]